MAGTIHRDPYRILIRKIGYSVGLENTLSRVSGLVHIYASTKELTSGSLQRLLESSPCEGGWGLRTTNIYDFLSALDLIKVESNSVFVLPTLDALAILRINLSDAQFERAIAPILAYSILSGDGDVFLNCLASSYVPAKVRDSLQSMVVAKRASAKTTLSSPIAAERIDRIITIENQQGNVGGRAAGLGVHALRRSGPLDESRGPLLKALSTGIEISDDYMRKVPARRRDWSRDLGLISSDGKATERGARLLSLFQSKSQYVGKSYTFWPYADEMAVLGVQPSEASWVCPSRLEIIRGLKGVFVDSEFGTAEETHLSTLEWLTSIYSVYRQLSPNRAMVRVELPLRVARLAALGMSCLDNGGDHFVDEVVSRVEKDSRRLEFRPSRQSEGSIVIRRG